MIIIKLKVMNADTSVNCHLSTAQSHRANLSEVIANFMFNSNVLLFDFIILISDTFLTVNPLFYLKIILKTMDDLVLSIKHRSSGEYFRFSLE